MKISKIFVTLITVIFISSSASAEEKILEFNSSITINSDASILVSENIKIESEGRNIKRGIYRDLPLFYIDEEGKKHKTDYDILEIKKDGRSEPYTTESTNDNKRIYIGNKDIIISPGIYNYSINYRGANQLSFFNKFDELYWNVTGNDWQFPIERAVAKIKLPTGANALQKIAYTGQAGAKGTNYDISIDQENNIIFSTLSSLAPKEGLTIAVSWPKGFIQQNNFSISYLVENLIGNQIIIILLAMILVTYYSLIWYKIGRDPQLGPIIPLFSPPKDFSPADAQYLANMGFGETADQGKAFAATIVDMAVKGYLKIEEAKKFLGKNFIITKIENAQIDILSEGEKIIAQQLFNKNDQIILDGKHNSLLKSVVENFANNIQTRIGKNYFSTNILYLVPALIISLALLFIISNNSTLVFIFLFLSVFITLIKIKSFFKIKSMMIGIVVLIPLLLLLINLERKTAITTLILLISWKVFTHLIQAPTLLGKKIINEIEGFKLFLSVAEKDRLEMFHPPEITPELFEKYLPFALALDVENKWGEKFAHNLSGGLVKQSSPSWYIGAAGFSYSNFGSTLKNNLSSSVVSAISDSKAASSGAGFSGGGRGGGGGGGW